MSVTHVGFIGLGHISIHAHLPGLAPLVEAGDVEFSAFCDISEEALAEQAAAFGARATYTDHHEMFEREQLDALYINLPPTLHTPLSTSAKRSTLHFFPRVYPDRAAGCGSDHRAADFHAAAVTDPVNYPG